MKSIFPIITISELQRSAKDALASIKEYAVIQSRGKDIAVLLHPRLGQALIESGMLRELLLRCSAEDEAKKKNTAPQKKVDMKELDRLVGNVILELSKQ